MSALSFDSLFPPESGSTSDRGSVEIPGVGSAADAGEAPARRRDSIQGLELESRTLSEASPWVLSLARRALEFVFSLLILIILLPLMIAAAALVLLGSDGPVFFRQRRMGRNGNEFTLYKFRSMRVEGECGSCITVVGDARITKIGAILRRYKLDEIPQFWNVLRGEMSLVGPRPKLPHHEALHMESRPGITGVATLAFRREEELLSKIPEKDLDSFYESFVKPAKAKMDMEYSRTATFGSDLRILVRTVASCLFGLQESLEHLEEIVAGAPVKSPAGPQLVKLPPRPVPVHRPEAAVQAQWRSDPGENVVA